MFLKLPSCDTLLAQMCWGTIGRLLTTYSMFAAGCLVVMTSVFALGAVTLAKLATSEPLAVPATELCMIRFIVQAASDAVIGLPSVHLSPERIVNVHVSLSDEIVHLEAR